MRMIVLHIPYKIVFELLMVKLFFEKDREYTGSNGFFFDEDLSSIYTTHNAL